MEVAVKMANSYVSCDETDESKSCKLETELRLGPPAVVSGGQEKDDDFGKNINVNGNGKRNFSQTVDLKLNFASMEETDQKGSLINMQNEHFLHCRSTTHDPVKPPPKAQLVGWPPVRSFRKNIFGGQKNKSAVDDEIASAFVKVSMDGAPYLRKVDLKMYNSYQQLSDALGNMFHTFTIGNYESEGMMDFMNESKLIDLLNTSDYVTTYEDKDEDWMLVGDVPWEMFVESCKRLRIMKGTEAIGLAPRALAKCKSRS